MSVDGLIEEFVAEGRVWTTRKPSEAEAILRVQMDKVEYALKNIEHEIRGIASGKARDPARAKRNIASFAGDIESAAKRLGKLANQIAESDAMGSIDEAVRSLDDALALAKELGVKAALTKFAFDGRRGRRQKGLHGDGLTVGDYDQKFFSVEKGKPVRVVLLISGPPFVSEVKWSDVEATIRGLAEGIDEAKSSKQEPDWKAIWISGNNAGHGYGVGHAKANINRIKGIGKLIVKARSTDDVAVYKPRIPKGRLVIVGNSNGPWAVDHSE